MSTNRRQVLKAVAGCAGLIACENLGLADESPNANLHQGLVVGEPTGEKVGAQVLADGGNAVDAIVAAALACTVAAPHQTGIGGYGAHAMFAVDGGKTLWALDANSTAPLAMKSDTFRPDAQGKVAGRVNEHGWLATGVPGILAGLQLALDRCGTQSFGDLVQPAIAIARTGIRLPAQVTKVLDSSQTIASDPGSRKLYLSDGKAPSGSQLFKNPELAEMLTALAKANSVEPFYRGEIAAEIAAAFQKNGGLVTRDDLAAYQARLTRPLSQTIGGRIVHTAPLTAGGLTLLQILNALDALEWSRLAERPGASRYLFEAARLAWADRLAEFGDPDFVEVPQTRLLSSEYARQSAERVRAAVEAGKPLELSTLERAQKGTIHLSAADRWGNLAALTLTHGGSFGAQVTVDGLGLTLGHGMSRFDPRPDHPNAPGPGKRPLNNMVPCIVSDQGRAFLAVGGRGGRKIPNAVLGCLEPILFQNRNLTEAMAAPRMHTEGSTNVEVEKAWPDAEREALAKFGYRVKTAASATLSAVAFEGGQLVRGMR